MNNHKDIESRILDLELKRIELDTLLEGMGPMSPGFSPDDQRRKAVIKQLELLKALKGSTSPPPKPKTNIEPLYKTVKARVVEIQLTDSTKTIEDILHDIADELTKTFEAVKAAKWITQGAKNN